MMPYNDFVDSEQYEIINQGDRQLTAVPSLDILHVQKFVRVEDYCYLELAVEDGWDVDKQVHY